MKTSRHLLDPIRHAHRDIEDFVHHRPRSSLGGLIFLGILVALGVWAWPEIRRTVHIHRM